MIRKAVRDDLPEIARVMRDSLAALSAGFYDERETASAVAYIAVTDQQLVDDGTYFVAEEDGRIVACGGWSGRTKLFTGTTAQAQAEGFLDPRTDAARIRAMFVEPSHARRGLGRQILEASEADARRAGFTRFELMATLPGVPLYTACGYEEIERDTIELPDGMRVGVVRMGRQVK